MENMLWLIEHLKSSLWSFVWEISHWKMLHVWIDQLKLTELNRDTNWEESIFYHVGDNWHTKNIQIKCWKSSVPDWHITHFDIWVLYKLSKKKTFLIVFPLAVLYWNITKNILYLKQIVTGDEKWIPSNNVKWKRLWSKQNEPPPTTPKTSLHPKKVMLCMWWDWKGGLYSFQKTR